jgi:lysophospholipase L1-like esterase
MGDSVTGIYYHTGGRQAYPELLSKSLRKRFSQAHLEIVNGGISGQSTSDGFGRLENDVLRHRPQLVTIMFGINDMEHMSVEKYRANLAELAARCRAVGAEVLFCTPNSFEETERFKRSKLRPYLDGMHAVGKQEGVPVCDVFAAFEAMRERDQDAFSSLLSDEIHPNLNGHKLTASVIARFICGQDIALTDEPPQQSLPRVQDLLPKKKPIRILAMPPYDTMISGLLTQFQAETRVEVSSWNVSGKTLAEIESDAKAIRERQPDLVIVAIPLMANIESVPTFARAYGRILNGSLSFALREWDVLALPPSLDVPLRTDEQRHQDEVVRRVILSKDLPLILRDPGNSAPAVELLGNWLRAAIAASP